MDPNGRQQYNLISATGNLHAGAKIGDIDWREVGDLGRQYAESVFNDIANAVTPSPLDERVQDLQGRIQWMTDMSQIEQVPHSPPVILEHAVIWTPTYLFLEILDLWVDVEDVQYWPPFSACASDK